MKKGGIMLDDIRTKLFHEAQRVRRGQKVASILDSLRGDLAALLKKQRRLKSEFEKEEREYEDISKAGIASFVYGILGSLEQRVEKERREAAAALLKFDQCANEVGKMREHIIELENERRSLGDAREKYDALSSEKERILLLEDNPVTRRLTDMEGELCRIGDRIREIDEAREAGRAVLEALFSTREKLTSAENWGLWDIFGGGIISTLIKHSRIDDANAAAKVVQEKLGRFRTELADIEISENISVDIGIFLGFADVFFDGLIADIAVQSKIANSQQHLQRAIRQTENVLRAFSLNVDPVSAMLKESFAVTF